jgi:hypothetical protein
MYQLMPMMKCTAVAFKLPHACSLRPLVCAAGCRTCMQQPNLSATPKVDLACCRTACPMHHHAHVPADAYDEVHGCPPSCCPTPAASLRSSALQGARPAQHLRGLRRLGGTDARAAAAMTISGSSSLTHLSVWAHALRNHSPCHSTVGCIWQWLSPAFIQCRACSPSECTPPLL